MKGTAIFTWHDGKAKYDEVAFDPRPILSEEALILAERCLRMDSRATRVQVAFDELKFVEAVRLA
jgi:hypothetical protein